MKDPMARDRRSGEEDFRGRPRWGVRPSLGMGEEEEEEEGLERETEEEEEEEEELDTEMDRVAA